MSRRHHICLAAAYGITAAILALTGEYAHAACALVTASIYADSCRRPSDGHTA